MTETTLWIIFGIVFVVAITFDLFIFQRKAHVVKVREALKLVAFWVALAMAFNVLVYFVEGPEKGLEFL
ncbi:MAG: TerC family protein, partial [Planctomycetota bacterium]|nr:TerC family protein [Planctomycetota bacterium]